MSHFNDQLYTVTVDEPKPGFRLTKDLIYTSDLLDRRIVIPTEFFTDFASIPLLIRGIIPVNCRSRRPATVHDFLCVNGKQLDITQKQADRVLLEAMIVAGVRFTRRQVMYRGVRAYQGSKTLFNNIRERYRR